MPGWLLAYVLSAAAAVACNLAWPEQFWPYAVLKPLTTLLVIGFAWQRGAAGEARRRGLLAGLVLSLLGDVALLWPQHGFLPGLVAFLMAHLAYLWAFTRGLRLAARPIAFVGYAVLAGVVLTTLWPGVPTGLRLPVAAYVLCLAAMAAQTAVWWLTARGGTGQALARRAAVGGFLFLVSDALLATNKFHGALPLSALWILASYWTAQWLLASSLPARR